MSIKTGTYLIILFSFLAICGLLFIIYGKETTLNTSGKNELFSYFIYLNVGLNSMSTICILLGRRSIKKRKIAAHKKFMISAFIFSSLFLIGYIYYHYNNGSTAFLGKGFIRPIYFTILISHLILAAITLPAVLVTFYFAFISKFNLHTAISTYTLYAWLYVSITGIIIYSTLQIFN